MLQRDSWSLCGAWQEPLKSMYIRTLARGRMHLPCRVYQPRSGLNLPCRVYPSRWRLYLGVFTNPGLACHLSCCVHQLRSELHLPYREY